MGKGANRTGSIDQLRNRRWRVRVTVDGRQRTVGTYPDAETARQMRRAFLAEVEDEAIVAPASLTLRNFGEDWLNRRELHGSKTRAKVRNIENERSLWRRHIEPSALADMAVRSIRVRDVEDFAPRRRRAP